MSAPSAQPDATQLDRRTTLKRLDDATGNLAAVYRSFKAGNSLTPELFESTSQTIRLCAGELERVRQDIDRSWASYWKQTNDQAYSRAGLNLADSVAELPLLP